MKHGKKFGNRVGQEFDIKKYSEDSVKAYREGYAMVQEQYRRVSKEADKNFEQLKKDLDSGRAKAIEQLYLGLEIKESSK